MRARFGHILRRREHDAQTNPTEPSSSRNRVFRGGSYYLLVTHLRAALRLVDPSLF